MPSSHLIIIQSTLGVIIFGTVLREHGPDALRRSALTVPLAGLFTVAGLGDLASVGSTVASAGTLEEGIGVMWITFGLIAPLLVLSHGHVLYALITRKDELSGVGGVTMVQR